MNNDLPRWKHKCPGCRRTIYWERVYCLPCIQAIPGRGNFRLTDKRSSYRKGPRAGLLTGMGLTRKHLFAMIKEYTLCVECGHKVRPNDMRHRCYFLTDAVARTLYTLRCRVCKTTKSKHSFPVFKRRSKILRSRVCSDCLHDSEVVAPYRRKYERRVIGI